jgi:hypothetical protein
MTWRIQRWETVADGAPPGMTSVWRIVPPERHADFVAREIGVLAGVTVLLGVVAVGLVGRRRPE